MSKAELLFYIGCLMLLVVPIVFIRHRLYDDGLVGRIALVATAVCAFAILGQAVVTYYDAWSDGRGYGGAGYSVAWEEAWLVFAIGVFLAWHYLRFHRRVSRCAPPPEDVAATWPGVRPSPIAAAGVSFVEQHDELADRRARKVGA